MVTNTFFMPNWDDSKKFGKETIRTILLGIAGFIIVKVGFDPYASQTAEVQKEKLRIKSAVIDDYVTKSYTYTSLAADVMAREPGSEKFFADGYLNFRIAQERIRLHFSDKVKNELLKVENKSEELKNCVLSRDVSNAKTAREDLKKMNHSLAEEALEEIGLAD